MAMLVIYTLWVQYIGFFRPMQDILLLFDTANRLWYSFLRMWSIPFA